MKVFEGIQNNYKIANAVVTVGMYDGVHLAHKLILQRVCNLSKAISGESVLITFEPHPRQILQPDEEISLLSSRQEKIALIEAIGIDVMIFLPFTLEFSTMNSFEFVKSIIVDTIHARKIVVGYNHFFGHNREGNFTYLSELGNQFGFDVEEIPEQDIQNESISSSKIRKALAVGDMMKANTYLDYEYPITGTIIPNESLFSSLGHKSWLFTNDFIHKLIPANGLYYVHIKLNALIHTGAVIVNLNLETEKQEIHLLLFGDIIPKSDELITIKFKHLVRVCSKQPEIEGLKNSIEAIFYKANQ